MQCQYKVAGRHGLAHLLAVAYVLMVQILEKEVAQDQLQCMVEKNALGILEILGNVDQIHVVSL